MSISAFKKIKMRFTPWKTRWETNSATSKSSCLILSCLHSEPNKSLSTLRSTSKISTAQSKKWFKKWSTRTHIWLGELRTSEAMETPRARCSSTKTLRLSTHWLISKRLLSERRSETSKRMVSTLSTSTTSTWLAFSALNQTAKLTSTTLRLSERLLTSNSSLPSGSCNWCSDSTCVVSWFHSWFHCPQNQS